MPKPRRKKGRPKASSVGVATGPTHRIATTKDAKAQINNLFGAIDQVETRMKANQLARKVDTVAEVEADLRLLHKHLHKVIQAQGGQQPGEARFGPSGAENKEVGSERAQKGETFEAWMKTHAPGSLVGQAANFDWNISEGGTLMAGVVAAKDLDAGELFMVVPRTLCLSNDTAKLCKAAPVLTSDRLCQNIESLSLVLHTMFEALDPTSFWRPYLDVLPRRFDLPLTWSLEELQSLKGTAAYLDTLKLQRSAVRQYVHFYRVFRKAGHLALPAFSYGDFTWATCVVMSRQNRIPAADSDGTRTTLALIPGWDMCNYAEGKIQTYYNVQRDASESAVMQPIRQGEQIYIYYGDRPNWKLLVYQGFVHDDHKTDSADLSFSLPASDELLKLKTLMLTKRRMEPIMSFTFSNNQDLPRQLLDWCRIATINKQEAAFAMKNPDAEVLSPRNEQASLTLLGEQLDAAVAELSTLAGDPGASQGPMAPGSRQFRCYLANRLRATQAAVFRIAADRVQERIAALNCEQKA